MSQVDDLLRQARELRDKADEKHKHALLDHSGGMEAIHRYQSEDLRLKAEELEKKAREIEKQNQKPSGQGFIL